MNYHLRNVLLTLTTMLSLSFSPSAIAMVVDFEPVVGTISGQDVFVVPFEVTDDVDLTWTLTDLETPAPFTNLGLAITTEDTGLLAIIEVPGLLDVSLSPGNYLAIVGGIAGGDANIGTFGLEISDLPVPAAVYLFGSALLGFLGLARGRRRAHAAT